MKKEDLYPAYWPEMAESSPDFGPRVIPPWKILEAQAVSMRATFLQERDKGAPLPDIGNAAHRRTYGTVRSPIPVEDFNINNIHCFQYIPATYQVRESLATQLGRAIRFQYPQDSLSKIQEMFRNELAHTMYHHAMWRHYGRRVYVLDRTTFTLLAETPLPALPASILASPDHSFYLKLPQDAFQFGVWNQWTGVEDKQKIEGVMVSLDNSDPDSDRPRELAILSVGSGDAVDNRNIAFISIGLGPDAKLDEVRFGEALTSEREYFGGGLAISTPPSEDVQQQNSKYANPLLEGAYELGVIVPRVILGFLLYLQSEHPDIEPVPPTPRRSFHEIRSFKQRDAALKHQELRLRGTTKLPILYVGRHLAQEIADDISLKIKGHLDFDHKGEQLKVWTLDHQVFVRGHWKRQPYGKEHALRKMIWIRPYIKGPEMVEVLRVRAAKVQKAQSAHAPPEVKVTSEPVRTLQRIKHTGADHG